MSSEKNNNLADAKKTERKRVRSPFLFPAYNFSFARQIAETVENDGGGSLSEEALAIALRLSVKSSGFQLRTLTAKQFGLLAKHRNILSTTPLAKAILNPTDDSEKRRALIQSFLTIPLFKEVADRFKGQPLPHGPAFRNILEQEFKIVPNRINDAERVLMDSAREIGVLENTNKGSYLSTDQVTHTTSGRKKEENDTVQELSPSPLYSTIPPSFSDGLITISEEDLAPFDDQEFWQIWNALGKIIRVRGSRQQKEEDTLRED